MWFRCVILAGLTLVSCGSREPRPDVVILCLDSLRADHFTPDTMPNLYAVTTHGVQFLNARANAPWTIPSIAGVFTGRLPSDHGLNMEATELTGSAIRRDVPTLAELFSAAGYSTAAFVTWGPLMPTVGFARGFDEYVEINRKEGSDIDDVVTSAVNFLVQESSPPRFVYIHSFAAHLPDTSGSYAEDVARTDSALVPLITYLLDRDTISVVFSDHGEDLSGDENRHEFALSEALLRVPLVLYSPGFGSKVRSEPVQLLDVWESANAWGRSIPVEADS